MNYCYFSKVKHVTIIQSLSNEIGLISVKVCSMRVTLHDLEERNIYELV